jgi:hypothetical protein
MKRYRLTPRGYKVKAMAGAVLIFIAGYVGYRIAQLIAIPSCAMAVFCGMPAITGSLVLYWVDRD